MPIAPRLLSGLLLATPAAQAQEPPDTRVQWIDANAVQVRSIDPADDDFTDLRPLETLIGDARVVSLGEMTHGDGATFHAKCRLIRYLHQELGFDVLVWESGLFDCRRVDEAFVDAEPIDDAVSRGIFPVWGVSAQVRPLFEYVRATRNSDSPLEIAGFDCQITSRQTPEALAGRLRTLLAQVPTELYEEPARKTIDETLAKMIELPFKLSEEEHDAFQKAMAELVTLLGTDDFGKLGLLDGDGAELLARVVRNKAAYEHMIYLYTRETEDEAASLANRMQAAQIREPAMADNLVWLARHRYKDRKLIVWAATSHMSYNEKTVEIRSGEGGWSFMGSQWLPMGETVKEALGPELYSIAFIAHHGSIGSVAGWSRELDAAPEGSLDDLCHRTGHPYLFVDLRSMPDRDGGTWLRDRIIARPRGYADMRTDWSQVCDAMFFTDEMYPSTRVPRPESEEE
ncbi:MAG: erythromycin esterase family protein [Planctomycetota bacterium]